MYIFAVNFTHSRAIRRNEPVLCPGKLSEPTSSPFLFLEDVCRQRPHLRLSRLNEAPRAYEAPPEREEDWVKTEIDDSDFCSRFDK